MDKNRERSDYGQETFREFMRTTGEFGSGQGDTADVQSSLKISGH